MSEVINRASVNVPWRMVWGTAINGLLAFGILITVLYCGGNLFEAAKPPTGYPFLDIFTYASRSVTGATGLAAIIIDSDTSPISIT